MIFIALNRFFHSLCHPKLPPRSVCVCRAFPGWLGKCRMPLVKPSFPLMSQSVPGMSAQQKRFCSIPVLPTPWSVQGMLSQHCQVFLPGPAVHSAFAFPPALLLSLDTASHSVWMLRKKQSWNLQNLQEAMPRFVLQLTGFGSSKFPEGCRVVCTRVWFWSVVNQGEFCWGCQGLLLSDYFGKGRVFLFLHNTWCAVFWFSLRELCCLWTR